MFSLKFLLTEGKIKTGVVDKDEKGHHVPKLLQVSGIPVFVSTSTNMNIDPESLNRMFLMEVDESQDQTKQIVNFTLESYSTLKINSTWEEHLRILTELVDNYRRLAQRVTDVVIPFSEKLSQIIPCENLTIRRDLPKILNLTSVIAFIHASNRYRLQDNEGANFIVDSFGSTEKNFTYTIIADPEDFKEALSIAGTTIKQTLNKINENSIKLYDVVTALCANKSSDLSKYADGNSLRITVKEVASAIGKSENRTRELMSQLERQGYLSRDSSTKEHTFVPTKMKFAEIKIDDIVFSSEDLESWAQKQIAKHGDRLDLIAPSCDGTKSKNDTKTEFELEACHDS